MSSNCIDKEISDENLHEGLRILARIIARDFMIRSAINGDLVKGSYYDDKQTECKET